MTLAAPSVRCGATLGEVGCDLPAGHRGNHVDWWAVRAPAVELFRAGVSIAVAARRCGVTVDVVEEGIRDAMRYPRLWRAAVARRRG